ncbi:MAG TPA: type II secretion system protein [Candidatus Paceibacterota bacterium]|nr:type II secretion system protein [Candidatus Paceibacterota bacterium]
MKKTSANQGFTLIELLVVIAIIGLLASVILASLNTARGKARDAARLSDMHTLETALAMYADDHGGQYPTSNVPGSICSGWETSSHDASIGKGFIQALTEGKYISVGLKDPSPSLDANCGNYGYYFYDAAHAKIYGCSQIKPFYILEIVKMDATGQNKYPSSPGFKCASRDWQTENGGVAWVTGVYQ